MCRFLETAQAKTMKYINTKPIVETIGKGKPVIGIVGAMHGDESGPAIIDRFKKTIQIKKGTIKFIIANPQAREKNVRFLDSDLNRCFPGKVNGNREERLAKQLITTANDVDYLIDLHSCSMESPPFCIIRSLDGNDMKLAKKSGLPFIVFYPLGIQKGGSFIDYVKCGIGLELGLHGKKKTIEDGYHATMRILKNLGIVANKTRKGKDQKILKVVGHIDKEKGIGMEPHIANFKIIKKDEVIGMKNKKEIRAKESFYPVLYKEKAYTDTLGWMAEEIDV